MDSKVEAIVGYNVIMMGVVVFLIAIPIRVARLEAVLAKEGLDEMRNKITSKVAPAMIQMNNSIAVLKV